MDRMTVRLLQCARGCIEHSPTNSYVTYSREVATELVEVIEALQRRLVIFERLTNRDVKAEVDEEMRRTAAESNDWLSATDR